MDHMLWCCEGRRVATVLAMPQGHEEWPVHLRLRGLVTKECNVDPFELWQFQKFATNVLIEMREDEKALGRTAPRGAERDLDSLLETVDMCIQCDAAPWEEQPGESTPAVGGEEPAHTENTETSPPVALRSGPLCMIELASSSTAAAPTYTSTLPSLICPTS
eukprot:528662-Amphidinium_carterae.3